MGSPASQSREPDAEHPASVALRVVGSHELGAPAARLSYGHDRYANTEPPPGLTTWLAVHADGHVTAYAGKVEYGQSIRTGFVVEIAEELGVTMDAVSVVLGDTDLVPWDMGTFGSQSTARVGSVLRRAAATAREQLIQLAADHLDLVPSELTVEQGHVRAVHNPSSRVSFVSLLEGQSIECEIDDDAPLVEPHSFVLMGYEHRIRVDALSKVTGTARYSQDMLPEGVLFASVVRPPAYGAKPASVDLAIAARLSGVVQTVHEDDLIAVLATSDEDAARAAAVVQVEWDLPPRQPSRWDMPLVLLETGRDGFTTQEVGHVGDALRTSANVLEATYYLPYISPAPMEPRAAVARWDHDHLTVWAGTQRPFGIRQELAARFHVDETQVRVIVPEIGGGFGAKSPYEVAHEAAFLARLARRPVRVALTRDEESMWSNFRPSALIQIRSGFDDDGRLTAWESHAYHAGERVLIGRRGSQTPYDVPHVHSVVYVADSPLPAGSYRSLGGAVNHFAREAHMDEIAAAVGVDPVELRLRNLSHPRFRSVLERAATASAWSGPRQDAGLGAGIAIGTDVGSYVAAAVELSVREREVRVHRVVVALDCGLVVNPEGARNQIEGAVMMGLGGALFEASDFEDGRLLNSSFARYRVPRITDTPQIDVEFVGDAGTPSTGAGEPGIVPIAPAIAGGVWAVTGTRHRELPIQRHL